MVPHALFVPSDHSVDLVLQLLTFAVIGALLASTVALVHSWLNPATIVRDRGDVGPPAWAAMSEVLFAAPRADFELPLPALSSLPTVYRCEHHGEITYTDRPCLLGRVRALTLRPS